MNDFIVRNAKESDVTELISLWNICFDDTEDFIFFFFENRFFPDYCVCITYKEKIVGAMHSMPVDQWIRKTKVKSAIIAGVATHPDFRGRGLMKKMFGVLMPLLKAKGISAVTYHPVNFNVYKSLGHLPSSKSLILKIPINPITSSTCKDLGFKMLLKELSPAILQELFNLYSKVAPSYSGMVARSFSDFSLKIKDYIASQANILFIKEKGVLIGYCIYFKTKAEIIGEEIIYFSPKALDFLIKGIVNLYSSLNITLRLPPDSLRAIPRQPKENFTIIPQNVTGVTDICLFLKQLKLNRFLSDDECNTFTIRVYDTFLTENNVIVNLNGDICKGSPKLSLDIGEFTQLLCGFLPASDTLNLTLNSFKKIIQALDKPNNRPLCWIIDEY